MNKIKIYYLLIVALLVSQGAMAIDLSKLKGGTLEHKIVTGFNIGATSPIPLPREVRSIESWWPQTSFQLGYNINYKIKNTNWGISSGISMNNKGMGARDKVKYMYTEVKMSDGKDNILKGYFVGKNETRVKLSYITVPLTLTYMPRDTWKFSAGGYVSYLSSGEFEGEVWDGYLREGTPDGEKVDIDDDKASFEFGNQLRRFDYGLTVGAERKLTNRFGVYGNLDWGLNSIFHSSFKGVSFNMYNIYLALGITYKL